MPKYTQNRGNHPHTRAAITSYLTLNPGSTVSEIAEGTKLVRQTVESALKEIAEPTEGSWPRRWVLSNDATVTPVAYHKRKAVPIDEAWARWIKATTTWPGAIAKLSQQKSPHIIAAGLEQLAANAAGLAVAFRAVQDEPDWLERIGG